MDVKFEDQNVDRHTDMTTSNHASPPAGAVVPNANFATLGMTTYENQTCTDAELQSIKQRKDAIEAAGRACGNSYPPGVPTRGAQTKVNQKLIKCHRLRCKSQNADDMQAIRQEKQARCFNDDKLDYGPTQAITDELKEEERRTHDQVAIPEGIVASAKARQAITDAGC